MQSGSSDLGLGPRYSHCNQLTPANPHLHSHPKKWSPPYLFRTTRPNPLIADNKIDALRTVSQSLPIPGGPLLETPAPSPIFGRGEMADLTRAFDWASTPLGPIATWPQHLLATVNLVLSAALPMQLFWGPQLIIFFNDPFIPIMRDKHPLPLGQPGRDCWKEAWPIVGEQIEGVFATGKAILFEGALVPILQDGKIRPMYWNYSYSAVYGPNGQVEGLLDIAQDVTASIEASKARRESEQHLNLAMQSADLGMWFYDALTGIVIADDRMHAIFGSPQGKGSIDYWLDLLHPDDSQRVGQHFADALAGKHPYELEYRIVRPDGIHWLRSKGRVVEEEHSPIRMFAIIEDITARKLTDQALRTGEQRLRDSQDLAVRSEAQLQLITDALPAYISYLDSDLRYRRVNRTYEQWFKRPASDIIGKSIVEVLGPEGAASITPNLKLALAGSPQHFEYKLNINGDERTLSVAHIPDIDAHGKARGVIVQGQDVTEQKRAEEALIQNEKLAAVGRLAASIAHEINNPLESVTNLIYLARNSPDFNEVQGFLETADRELRRVSVISSQTLRFYKQSSRPSAITPRDLFESVLSIYQGRLVNSHVHVEMRDRTTRPIECFEGEIRQVLNNLIGNAIDALHVTGGRLLVRGREATHWTTGTKGVVLTVADTGAGIAPHILAKIFQAFFTTKGIGGTGLGLWVSKEIIGRHHGALQVRSSQAPGHNGTVFTLFLPFDAVVR